MTMTETQTDGYVLGNIYVAGTVVDWTGPAAPRLAVVEQAAERRGYPVIPLRLVEVTRAIHALGYLVVLKRPTPLRPVPHLWLRHWGLVLPTFERAVPRGPEAVVVAVVSV